MKSSLKLEVGSVVSEGSSAGVLMKVALENHADVFLITSLHMDWNWGDTSITLVKLINPLSPTPMAHICVYPQRMPHLQVFLSHSVHSSGARLGETSAHAEPSLAIPLMIFMTTQESNNWGSKWRLD